MSDGRRRCGGRCGVAAGIVWGRQVRGRWQAAGCVRLGSLRCRIVNRFGEGHGIGSCPGIVAGGVETRHHAGNVDVAAIGKERGGEMGNLAKV